MRRFSGLAALALALAPLGAGAVVSGAAAQDVVVQGASFPDATTFVSHFGCADVTAASTAPSLRVNLGPGTAPRGVRSLGVTPAGAGTATGPVHTTTDLSSTTLAFSARGGGSGVAFAWYAAPGTADGLAWRGAARFTVPGAAWTRVAVEQQSFAWDLVEVATGRVVEQAPAATLTDFTAARGPGPGHLLAGLGCDGVPFHLDAVDVDGPAGPRSYDLEGLALHTTIERVASGDPGRVVLRGVTRHGAGAPVGQPLVLEAAPAGTNQWQAVGDPVLPDAEGVVSVEVKPRARTAYRWRMPESQYAEAHVSAPLVLGPGPGASGKTAKESGEQATGKKAKKNKVDKNGANKSGASKNKATRKKARNETQVPLDPQSQGEPGQDGNG